MLMPAKYVTKITFRSRLSREQVMAVMQERMPAFARLEGLIQKFYLEGSEPDTYSGVYLWASKEAMEAYLKLPLKESIAGVYEADQEPKIEILSVVSTLRPD